jgi:hypothetical protein
MVRAGTHPLRHSQPAAGCVTELMAALSGKELPERHAVGPHVCWLEAQQPAFQSHSNAQAPKPANRRKRAQRVASSVVPIADASWLVAREGGVPYSTVAASAEEHVRLCLCAGGAVRGGGDASALTLDRIASISGLSK